MRYLKNSDGSFTEIRSRIVWTPADEDPAAALTPAPLLLPAPLPEVPAAAGPVPFRGETPPDRQAAALARRLAAASATRRAAFAAPYAPATFAAWLAAARRCNALRAALLTRLRTVAGAAAAASTFPATRAA